jgi:hypothetical protein
LTQLFERFLQQRARDSRRRYVRRVPSHAMRPRSPWSRAINAPASASPAEARYQSATFWSAPEFWAARNSSKVLRWWSQWPSRVSSMSSCTRRWLASSATNNTFAEKGLERLIGSSISRMNRT